MNNQTAPLMKNINRSKYRRIEYCSTFKDSMLRNKKSEKLLINKRGQTQRNAFLLQLKPPHIYKIIGKNNSITFYDSLMNDLFVGKLHFRVVYLAKIWKRIKKVSQGSRAARVLCEHLQFLGVDARMIEEEGNQIAVTGQNIDLIEVNYTGASQMGPARYNIYYGIRCNLEGVEKQFQVRIKVKTKGLIQFHQGANIRREILNVRWEGKGKDLADKLNSDDELMKRLIHQLKEGEGPQIVDLSPVKKAGVVWITTTMIMLPFQRVGTPFQIPNYLMPSETSLQLYNAIARHIHSKINSKA